MLASTFLTTLTRAGRATVSRVGRSALSPCRLGRNVNRAVRRRQRAERVADVDWFDGIEPDELAG